MRRKPNATGPPIAPPTSRRPGNLLGAEDGDPDVRHALSAHHDQLRAAMRAALDTARLRPGLDPDATAEQLALLAYGINLRSRSGTDAADLRA